MSSRQGLLYPRAPFYFAALLLLALAGFSQSYFMHLGQNDWVHHFHGIVATAWMLMLILQGTLMRTGRMTLHRRVGKSAYVLAPLFVLSGFLIVHAMLTSTGGFARTYGSRLAFVDLTSSIYFGFAVYWAVRYRRQTALHARWIVTTAVLLIPPALSRLSHVFDFVHSFDEAFHYSFFLIEAVTLALLVDDYRKGGVRAPYLVLLALVVVQHISYVVTPGIPAWQAFCRGFGEL